jgi:hypothetical protein
MLERIMNFVFFFVFFVQGDLDLFQKASARRMCRSIVTPVFGVPNVVSKQFVTAIPLTQQESRPLNWQQT